MDHLPKKKQKRILIKLKSWTKKLVVPSKTNTHFDDNDSIKGQVEWNETIPQITHPPLDDSGIGSKDDIRMRLKDDSIICLEDDDGISSNYDNGIGSKDDNGIGSKYDSGISSEDDGTKDGNGTCSKDNNRTCSKVDNRTCSKVDNRICSKVDNRICPKVDNRICPKVDNGVCSKDNNRIFSKIDNGICSKRNSRNLTWMGDNNASGTLNSDNTKSLTMLSTIERQKTSKIRSTKHEKLNSLRRNSLFGLTSRLSSRLSRISILTTSNNNNKNNDNDCINNDQQPKITLPDLIEDNFNFDFIFDDFDQLCKIDDSNELEEELNDLNQIKNNWTEFNNLTVDNENKLESIHEELYNAFPIIEEICEERILYESNSLTSFISPSSSLIVQPLPSTNNSPSSSENPIRRISFVEVECLNCTYMNHPVRTVCESCNTCLPGPSGRSSQYSVPYNNKSKSIISDNNLSILTKTQMTLLKKSDVDYITVKKMFYSEIPRGIIKGIIRLDMPTKLIKVHEKYKFKVAKLSGKNVDDVTYSMFHGTTTSIDCNPDRFLDKNYLSSDKLFCKKGCGMCGIIQNGNRKKFSKHNKKMWFANSALISRDYTDVNCHTKVMFVVDIVAQEHNYILVVNKNKATLPRFMILFD
ncbi:hypothetical protein RclHR1_22070001 [Rhizophagus clarus]|uniref:Sex-determining region Y protein-like n=1 Tax=Rhizophagus clarus TaxID=94130 RepID=A0A2Z6RNE9_9GLOM|nr:hypothetical protein RclHR1_22070001 [Rhizophagus clarus]GES98528.1 sex-determining region Y protein-like [Rhizophagus clarus]